MNTSRLVRLFINGLLAATLGVFTETIILMMWRGEPGSRTATGALLLLANGFGAARFFMDAWRILGAIEDDKH